MFSLELYRVTRSKDYTLILSNLISNQILHKHVTDVKKIDFNKLAEFKIDQELADAFLILSTNNVSEIFEIPNSSSNKSRLKVETNIDKEQIEEFENINEEYISNSMVSSNELEKELEQEINTQYKDNEHKIQNKERILYDIIEE